MGDRANVRMIDEWAYGEPVNSFHFYTHWAGYKLPGTVADALDRGRSRWNDGQYLARIIFNEMTRGVEMDTTGYGISIHPGDGDDRIITVNPHTQEVTDFDGVTYPFEAFVQRFSTGEIHE